MRRLIRTLFVVVAITPQCWADDAKLSELSAATTWNAGDLVYTVLNPSTTPTQRKMTIDNLLKVATSENNILVAATDSPDSIKAIANYTCDGTDDETQINAAIADLPAAGGVVVLGPGNFVAEGINLVEAVTIRGAGMDATTIDLPAIPSTAMFVAGADAEFNGGGIYDLTLDGNSKDAGNQNALDFSAVTLLQEFFIERCRIKYFNVGIRGAEAGTPMDRYLTISNTLIWQCVIGLLTNEHPRIINCDFRNCTTGISANFSHAHIEYTKFCYCVDGIKRRDGGSTDYLTLVNCSFYANSGTSLELGRWGIVSSCLFLGDEADVNAVGINMYGSGRNSINNNVFGASGYQIRGGFIVFSHSTAAIYGGTITGNQFWVDDLGASNTCILAAASCHQIYGLSVVGNTFHCYDPGTCIDLREAARVGWSLFTSNTFVFLDTAGATYGIRYDESFANGNVIANNTFGGPSNCANAVGLEVDARNSVIAGNHFKNVGTPITLVNSNANTRIVDNIGFATEKGGTATVPNGATYVDVTHSLAATPSTDDIQVTPTNTMGNAAKFWISDLGATTFRINVNADPGATTATFSWRAEVY